MEEIIKFIEQNQTWIMMGLVGFSLLLLIISLSQSIRISKWKKKYLRIMGGKDHKSIEEMLVKHNNHVGKILEGIEDIHHMQRELDESLKLCVQKVGMVRYNAFNDMGSDLSYSIALLNDTNDGIVLSGIYGREFCNTYAKPILKGKSSYKLTAEEILAMDRAEKNSVCA